ncbi:MAG: hypothetical protein ACEQSC_01230, partial [Candidatus Nanopelagicaceae bacterium]
SNTELRRYTAKTIRSRRENVSPVTQLEPANAVIDVQAVEVPQARTKLGSEGAIREALKDRRLKIVKALEEGDTKSIRSAKADLDLVIQDGRDLIAANKNNPLSQKTNLSAELSKKESFGKQAIFAADSLDQGTTMKDIKSMPGFSETLKSSMRMGFKARTIDNEGGFSKIESILMGLIGAAAIPVAPVVAPVAIGGALIAALKNSAFAKSDLGQTRIPGLDFLDNPLSQVRGTISKTFFTPKGDNENSVEPLIKGVNLAESALSKLAGVGKLALGVFGGFTALSIATQAITTLGGAVLNTARNIDTLQVKLAAASDSPQSGKASFTRISKKADDLGVSRSSALEVGAGIAGTTFGTELQGSPSDRLTDQTLEFFKLRGLNKQQQEGFQLAANQTLGRKNLSGQEVNQFIQSAGITDTRSIAARGLGMTPAQFAQAQETTGIDSKKFMQAFLSQGLQDARTSQEVASNSIGFKESKLSARVEQTTSNIGAALSPAYKVAIDLLTSSVQLLETALKAGGEMLIGFAVKGMIMAGQALTNLAIAALRCPRATTIAWQATLPSVRMLSARF